MDGFFFVWAGGWGMGELEGGFFYFDFLPFFAFSMILAFFPSDIHNSPVLGGFFLYK